MEEAPILQIKVLKGPRKGEILVCNPESTIHVGRVMKGNNLALRDPGISQQHLRFRFIEDDFRWFVSDLDTSNGTKLNGSLIQASALVPVSDGDVFAIGEKTELGVKIVARMVLEEEGDGMNVVGRRATRRGGSSGVNVTANLSRVSGGDVLKEAQSKAPAPSRGRKKNVSEEADVCQKGAGRGKRDVATRNDSRVLDKEESRDSLLVSQSETEEPDQNGDAKVRRNPRRAKSSKVLKEIDGNCVVDSVPGVKEGDMKKKGKGKRSTKSTGLEMDKENDDVVVLKLDLKSSDPDQVAIPDARKGKKTRSSVDSSMVLVEEEEGEEDAGMKKVGVEEEERNSEEDRADFEEMTLNSEEGRADFEKMTLNEWFDNMEIFLPKAINDEAEKIIDIVKEKARKFDELLEQTDAGVFSHL